MRRCPHCAAKSLRLLQLARSSEERPVTCRACGQHSFIPHWLLVPALLAFEVSVWCGVVLALWLGASVLLVASIFRWLGWHRPGRGLSASSSFERCSRVTLQRAWGLLFGQPLSVTDGSSASNLVKSLLFHAMTANPSIKGTSRRRAAPYVERYAS
jgi:hypothetical protein